MALRAVGVVEQRHRAVLAVVRRKQSFDEVAAAVGVHPDTVRRWVRRFLEEGVAGLSDRPRTPHSSPGRLAEEIESRIVAMRQAEPDWGPRRIRAELGRAGLPQPARSTVEAVLRRNGLAFGRRKRTPVAKPKRFVAPAPNDTWQLDAWEFRLADGTTAEVVDVLDDHSRVVLSARAFRVADGAAVWTTFEEATTNWGLPRRVLTDNAGYFTGRRRGVVSDFERRLWRLGVATVNGAPAHPQTQGKIERLHRTARAWLRRHGPPGDIDALQELLDAFARHYNFDRPHQGLNDRLPADVWHGTPRVTPDASHPPSRTTLRRVYDTGVLRYGGWVVNVGAAWAGCELEVVEQADKVRIVFGAELVASFSTEEPPGSYIANGRPRGGTRRPRR